MQPTPAMPRYPVIVSNINNPRCPDRAQMRIVTLRIFNEIHAGGPNRIRHLRRALLIARAALGLPPR